MVAPLDPTKSTEQQVAEWFSQGDELYARSSAFLAVGYYQWITEVDPSNGRAWRMLGLCSLVGLGGEGAALRGLRKAIELDPLDSEARKALDRLESRLAENPNLIEQGQRQFDELFNGLLERLGSESKTHAPETADDTPDEGNQPGPPVQKSQREIVGNMSADRQAWFAQGLFNGKMFNEALEIYELMLEANPENFNALLNRASCLAGLGRADEAVQVLERLTASQRNSVDAWHNLGASYGMIGKREEAVRCYRRAADLGSRKPETWVDLAACYFELAPGKNADQALLWLNRSIAIAPDFAAAHGLRGRILDQLGRDKEALLSYDRCLSLNPGSPGEMFGRGLVLMRLNRIEEAARAFEDLTMSHPETAGAWANLAVCQCMMNQFELGMRTATIAVARFPNDQAVVYQWGMLRRRQKGIDPQTEVSPAEDRTLNCELQIALLRLQVDEDPTNVVKLGSLGDLYLALDDFERAEEAFQAATTYGSTRYSDWINAAGLADLRKDHQQVLLRTGQALKAGWSNPAFSALRGLAYSRVGNLLEGRRWLRRAVAAEPDNADYIDWYTSLANRIGEVQGARDVHVSSIQGKCVDCGGSVEVELTILGYDLYCPNCRDPRLASPEVDQIRSFLVEQGLDVFSE